MQRFFVLAVVALFFTQTSLFALLRSPDNQADYIIITHKQLDCPTLHDFELHRFSNGLNVRIVFVDNIYAEFSAATPSASIRQFLSYTLTQWKQPSVRYVLLAGGVQFVPSNIVPSLLKDDPNFNEKELSLDALYAVNQDGGDNIPDIALGRLPARSVEELSIMLGKTMQYEKIIRNSDFSRDMLGIADKENNDIDYFNDILHSSYLSMFTSQRAKAISLFEKSPDFGTRQDILANISTNPKYLIYIGHSNSQQWSRTGVLLAGDVEKDITNIVPFIYTDVAGVHRFDDTLRQGMVEKFLSKPIGGAVASIASAGLMYMSVGTNFMQKYYQIQVQNRVLHIGDAFLQVQQSSSGEMERNFTLLGDPYLLIPTDQLAGDTPLPDEESVARLSCTPSVAASNLTFAFTVPVSAHVRLALYDHLGKEIAVVTNSVLQAGEYSIPFDVSTFAEGMYLCRLIAGNTDRSGKFIVLR